MLRVSLFLVAVVVGAQEEAPPTGFIWLVSGCSISTYMLDLTTKLFNKFHPKVCARDTREMYNQFQYKEDGFKKHGRLNLVETKRQDDDIFGNCDENRSRFVVGKLTYSNYLAKKTTDFDDVPPFIFGSAVRSNIPEYLACLIRDQQEHDFLEETGLPLEDIGYLVDAERGEAWHHKAAGFREDKAISSAYLRTENLPKFLDVVYSAIMLSHRNVLLDTHAGGTVYNTEDLLDLSTEEKQRSAAGLWVSLLARGGTFANVDDVMNVLKKETPVPSDLKYRIFNLDAVRQALNGTDWERMVYCPDEWNALQHSRGKF